MMTKTSPGETDSTSPRTPPTAVRAEKSSDAKAPTPRFGSPPRARDGSLFGGVTSTSSDAATVYPSESGVASEGSCRLNDLGGVIARRSRGARASAPRITTTSAKIDRKSVVYGKTKRGGESGRQR